MIYKRNVDGSIQVWEVEVMGDKYCTTTGKLGGKMIVSAWTKCFPKNIGKKNETSGNVQAFKEAMALQTKKLEREYHDYVNDIDTSRFFKPMLATKWENRKSKAKFPVFCQPKLDGIRCIARKDGLWTRQGKKITACPHIEKELASFFSQYPVTILDGELYNHSLKDDFNQITSIVRKQKPTVADFKKAKELIQYHIYDLPNEEGFKSRFEWLKYHMFNLLPDETSYIILVDEYECRSVGVLDLWYDFYLKDGYEGQIIRIDAPYEQKRSNNLIKRKEFIDDEFEVLRIEEGKGNWAGYAKRIVLIDPKSQNEFGAGVKGNKEFCKKLLEQNPPPEVATIRYFSLTPDGVPRFPVAVDFDRSGT